MATSALVLEESMVLLLPAVWEEEASSSPHPLKTTSSYLVLVVPASVPVVVVEMVEMVEMVVRWCLG